MEQQVKYTRDYVLNNKVCILCDTDENKLKTLQLLCGDGINDERKFGGFNKHNVHMYQNISLAHGKEIALLNPRHNHICHSNDGYWSKQKGYVQITCQQFFIDNSICPIVELYY